MFDKSAYEDKLAREKSWWEPPPVKNNVLNWIIRRPLFFSMARILYAYVAAKNQMAETLNRYQKGKVDKLLIAPCGAGDDFKYLSQFGDEIHGIDLTPLAIKSCPPQMLAKAGDILESGYPDNTFDLIASPLFFHHLVKFGFEPFLKEFHRILKPGGSLVILEPSILYPVNIITRPIKWIFHNPLNEVEDESPFYPGRMIKALKQTGYTNITLQGATFSHVLFPISIARLFNVWTKPLLGIYPFKYLAWMVVYRAVKKR